MVAEKPVGQRQARVNSTPCFVLHTYPYRETSLLVEVLSADYGRVAMIAKGARRPRSPVRGQLMAFQPLLMSWYGKGEVRTLHEVEWQGGVPQLAGLSLMCGFYANEILLRALPREDAYPELFAHYAHLIAQLAQNLPPAALLRAFEWQLLTALGYSFSLSHDAEFGQALEADQWYRYVPAKGAVKVSHGRSSGSHDIRVLGQTLLDLSAHQLNSVQSKQQAKQLLKALLQYHMGDAPLHTPQLLRDLSAL